MTRLILTTDDSGAGALKGARIADAVIPFGHRFVWGPLPSATEIAKSLMPLAAEHDDAEDHRLTRLYRKHLGEINSRTGFTDLCEQFDAIDLWIDPDPNAQLILIWLLDTLRPHENIVSKLNLLQADAKIGHHAPEQLLEWRLPAVKIRSDHLQTASTAWQAYRAPTPWDWFNLLSNDPSVLPRLEPAIVALLEELPMRTSGLGATEMRMLELISEGNTRAFSSEVGTGSHEENASKQKAGAPFRFNRNGKGSSPSDVFPGHEKRNQRRVFGYWEVGSLLDGLAHDPAPAVAGLDEGPFTPEMHDDPDRHRRYKQSRLSLTALGQAVLAEHDDFSRHNPIHRWWGGTELTSERLWRWDRADRVLIEP